MKRSAERQFGPRPAYLDPITMDRAVASAEMRIQDRIRMNKAQARRDSRIERNIRNEAAQGRYPEQLECRCGAWGEVNYDDGAYRGYFCGGSERCCP